MSGALVRDQMGRAVQYGVPTAANYDSEGFIDNQSTSLAYSTNFTYDFLGRFNNATAPNGYQVTKSYDVYHETFFNSITNSNEQRIVTINKLNDNEDRESSEFKDIGGNVVRTEVKKNSSAKIVTKFESDLHGYAKLIESNGTSIGEKQFDSIGGLEWMKSPDGGKFEYVYNNKLLVSKVINYGKNVEDSVKIETDYLYDSLNRLSQITYPTTTDNVTYQYYDNTGEGNKYARSAIKSIAKGSYYLAEYNFGQLWLEEKKTIESASYQTKYTYDVQGRISSVLYPDAENVSYAYDEGGYLKSISGTQNYISNIKYNEFGQRTYVRYGNGLETTYQYTPETGLLNFMKQKDKNGTEILNYDYDFDLTGNLTSLINAPGGTQKSSQSFSYDKLGRISAASGNYNNGESVFGQSYGFDDDNRILFKTFESGMRYDFNYLGNTHAVSNIMITGSPAGERQVNFNYDDFGNMTRKELIADSGNKITNFQYDDANRLKHIDLPDEIFKLDFKYSNGGQRITKTYSDNLGVVNHNVYVTGFYDITNGVINKHISDGKYIFATKVDNDDNNILYYTQNNIGSTVMLTDKDSNKVQGYLYQPFGEMWVEENPSASIPEVVRLFTGQMYDKESGLYYMNARYYDPHLGSFITPDPGMDGYNHYVYANSNPIKYMDPTGMDEDDDGGFSCDDSYGCDGDDGDNNNNYDGYNESQDISYGNLDMTPGVHSPEYNALEAFCNDWNSVVSAPGVIGQGPEDLASAINPSFHSDANEWCRANGLPDAFEGPNIGFGAVAQQGAVAYGLGGKGNFGGEHSPLIAGDNLSCLKGAWDNAKEAWDKTVDFGKGLWDQGKEFASRFGWSWSSLGKEYVYALDLVPWIQTGMVTGAKFGLPGVIIGGLIGGTIQINFDVYASIFTSKDIQSTYNNGNYITGNINQSFYTIGLVGSYLSYPGAFMPDLAYFSTFLEVMGYIGTHINYKNK